MSKERMEELEAKYSTLTITSERDGIEYTDIDVKDLVFLIQNGFKQAERVQELEEECVGWKEASRFNDEKLEKQNKRYREALKEILTLEKYNETDNFWDNDDDFYMYIQNTAEKALEESK